MRLTLDPLFTPESIKTEAWYDASDLSTLTLDGNNVDGMADKSGNGYDLDSLSGAEPQSGTRTLNDLNVLDFDGSEYLKNITDTVLSGNPSWNISIVVIYDTHTVNTDNPIMVGLRTNEQCVGMTGGSGTGGYSFRFYGANEVYNGSVPTATPLIQVGTRPDASQHGDCQMFVDGTELTVGSQSNPTGVSDLKERIYLGADTSGVARIDGAIAEVIITQDNSTATRQKIEGYLAWKWGLLDSLPSGHPYKSVKPLRTD